ncbi:hypothetical protein G6732_00025 [Polynucleobacter paneuropaeus]|nr:hypothetical protein [Polynucleobacter paneuropaeus]
MKFLIRQILKKFNIGITSYNTLHGYITAEKDFEDILALPMEHLTKLLEVKNSSKSQIKQDLFVLLETNFKRNGYFVEFGATNGRDLSNTYLLEKEFNWRGILAEPARIWHADLEKNRVCSIEQNCVWSDSNTLLDFNEVSEAELSTITKYNNNDWASRNR